MKRMNIQGSDMGDNCIFMYYFNSLGVVQHEDSIDRFLHGPSGIYQRKHFFIYYEFLNHTKFSYVKQYPAFTEIGYKTGTY